MNIFETYFSARKRFAKWGDDRKRRTEAINIVFSDNAFDTLMIAIGQVQDNLSKHLVKHRVPDKEKIVPPVVDVEDNYSSYADMEKLLEV